MIKVSALFPDGYLIYIDDLPEFQVECFGYGKSKLAYAMRKLLVQWDEYMALSDQPYTMVNIRFARADSGEVISKMTWRRNLSHLESRSFWQRMRTGGNP